MFTTNEGELIIYELKVTANSDPTLTFIDDLHATALTAAQHASNWLTEHLGLPITVKAILASEHLRNGASFRSNGEEVAGWDWTNEGATIKIRERLVKP